ncbi:MAG: aminomethyl-transferring glycine dehydrogenase subunit GcvPB [Lachnospiraceae bacterium]|nr:aminomethyl-transferring glycine dehydrogenase subunit GcvPB [Lachnospiraceae bacterium]
MKLIFEMGAPGRGSELLPVCKTPYKSQKVAFRKKTLRLPEVSETELSRHYTELAKQTHGVNDGFYPLGSCTMKYNPKVNEEAAALPGFTQIHPLQDSSDVQGCLTVLSEMEKALCEITGMDACTLQPAAGAHGEFTGLLLMKAYHVSRGDIARKKIIVPDSAHGTNPASAAMAGFDVVNIASNEDGCVDLEALKRAVGEDTAGLMLTNPNTVGLFDPNIAEITRIVHEAGGLCYYDGANLNAIMGITRPGDMGFDVMHLNLHKTFSTPHGGGGPGSGPVACKEFLAEFLPGLRVISAKNRSGKGQMVSGKSGCKEDPAIRCENEVRGFRDELRMDEVLEECRASGAIGDVRSFCGNFLVIVRAYAYILTLGREGIPEAATGAVLNANYMMHGLKPYYRMAYDRTCMHEFVVTLEQEKHDRNVSALDIAKALLDHGIHPPTMYFPLIVHEALMIEPTETESRETLDAAIQIFAEVLKQSEEKPEEMHQYPQATPIGRPDEVSAARKPVVRYEF